MSPATILRGRHLHYNGLRARSVSKRISSFPRLRLELLEPVFNNDQLVGPACRQRANHQEALVVQDTSYCGRNGKEANPAAGKSVVERPAENVGVVFTSTATRFPDASR